MPSKYIPHPRIRTFNPCSIEGCIDKATRRGWCGKHYRRWLHHGDPYFVDYGLKHGEGRDMTPEYRAWAALKNRCSDSRLKNYGGRGIEVCERWAESYENFLADMGRRPPNPEGWISTKPYWSLDRMDNNGNYEPGNCRWATWKEQANNRRPRRRFAN